MDELTLPRFYPIADAGLLAQHGIGVEDFARQMSDAGVMLLQYRDKQGRPEQILRNAALVKMAFHGTGCMLILNDHAGLARLADWDGVHLGQSDLAPSDLGPSDLAPSDAGLSEHGQSDGRQNGPAQTNLTQGKPGQSEFAQEETQAQQARRTVTDGRIIGVSTHTDAQIAAGDAGCADYIAIGPVFATSSKENAEPAVGLEGVRRARALTSKPLVAIGGITRANCKAVIEAGADSVAVISELFSSEAGSPRKVAGDFLRLLRQKGRK